MGQFLWLQLCCLVLLAIAIPATVQGIPRFISPPSFIQVPESTPVGTAITSLQIENGQDLTIESMTPAASVREEIRVSNKLIVDVILAVQLDYENTQQQQLTLRFRGYDRAQANPIIMYHEITMAAGDVNDVAPRFENLPYSASVPENSAKGITVYTNIIVTDPDVNDYPVLTMTSNAQGADSEYLNKFIIDKDTGVVTLNEPLDFETNRFYQYTVMATDQVGHNVSTDLYITVEDQQDMPPYFIGEPFIAKIPEESPLGTEVLTVRAQDRDVGIPNSVELTVIDESCPGIFQMLDKTTGKVTVKSVPDRDSGDIKNNYGICTLTVQAKEGTEHPQSVDASRGIANTTVIITIENINDNPLVFSQTSYVASVDENSRTGTLISFTTPISVTGVSQTNNGIFNLSIRGYENSFDVKQRDCSGDMDVAITVADPSVLDYEKLKSLTFALIATDTSPTFQGVIRESTATVAVNINNHNDNSPVFLQQLYTANINEAAPLGTRVVKVLAVDADKNDVNNYGTVTYSLADSNSGFSIDPITGAVLLRTQVDREVRDSYSLTVIAEDGGHFKAFTQLQITVDDFNDNAPQFESTDYQIWLKENEANFDTAVQIQATDADEHGTPNSEIVYTIDSTSPPGLEPHFRLNSTTGALSVVHSLDYEALTFPPGGEGQITLLVQASDRGVPQKMSYTTVLVSLLDESE